jgi:hypothetical protein
MTILRQVYGTDLGMIWLNMLFAQDQGLLGQVLFEHALGISAAPLCEQFCATQLLETDGGNNHFL